MNVVLDASVALKWFFRHHADESGTDQAMMLLKALDTGRFGMCQPPHFLAEMAAVLARKRPDESQTDLEILQDIDWRFAQDPDLYATALELAIRLEHHLFDTLYHAVALLDSSATLVTADRTYYDKAKTIGRIALLRDFRT